MTMVTKLVKGGDIPQGAPNHKFTRLLNEVALRGHVTNKIDYISTCRGSIDTKIRQGVDLT